MGGKRISKLTDEILATLNWGKVNLIWAEIKDDNVGCLNVIEEIERLFTRAFELNCQSLTLNTNGSGSIDELFKIYDESFTKVCNIVNWNNKTMQFAAVSCCMKLMSAEGNMKWKANKGNMINNFPFQKLEEVIKCCLILNSNTVVVEKLKEYLALKDVLFHSWKVLKELLPKLPPGDSIISNILNLLEHMVLPKDLKKDMEEISEELLCNEGGLFQLNVKILKKWVGKVWQTLTNIPVSQVTHRRILLLLNQCYLAIIPNPIFLTDYLMGSLSQDGPTSLLALHGMSVLMQKHNIEYPNVYGRLYTLLTFEMLHSKFSSRMLYLVDVFLSSTYLPEQLVAAFAKRLARLALTAPVPVTVTCIRLIGNLMLRHPGLKRMIHHPYGGEVAEDPYDMSVEDPMKTNASESSLWELKLLANHVQPRVSSAATFIDANLPAVEWDLAPLLATTPQQVFQIEAKKKFKETSVTFYRPQSIGQLSDDRLYKLWSLT